MLTNANQCLDYKSKRETAKREAENALMKMPKTHQPTKTGWGHGGAADVPTTQTGHASTAYDNEGEAERGVRHGLKSGLESG